MPSTYVALSYVWGQVKTFRLLKANKEDVMTDNGLDVYWNDIPLTIRDAVSLVHKAGIRYLWVDALCLVQDDPDDMKNGIGIMDTVYEQSLFTLVAATGVDADHGIPGVRDNSRHAQQLVCDVAEDIQLMAVPDGEALLEATKYNQRGWT